MTLFAPVDPMTKARTALVLANPFFGVLAMRLRMKADPSAATAWCDGVSIGYNPAWTANLSSDQRKGLIAHEILHAGFLHTTRRGGRHRAKWNIACDFAINQILVDSGFVLPDDGCLDAQYRGMSAEEIYNKLPDFPPVGRRNNGGQGYDDLPADPGGCGEVRDAGTSSPEVLEAINAQLMEEDWKQAMAQAAHQAKRAGRLPAGLERLLEAMLEPLVNWKDVLRRFLTERTLGDSSWQNPNRRFVHSGLYLPAARNEPSGEVVVAIDTSGSIGAKELSEFGAELEAIKTDVRPTRTIVIYCDAAVNKVVEFAPDDPLELECVGGGGTDFRPPFHYLEEHGIDPKCLVYLTDGYGPFPNDEEVAFPTLWAITTDVVSPLGETLALK